MALGLSDARLIRRAGLAWCALAGLLMAGALLAIWIDTTRLDWQPRLALDQPWRWWSAAFVHYSPLHLAANLAGALLVAALGWVARLPMPAAWAWFAAWPLTHLALGLQPALVHYGGLSGVLHAGVAVAAVQLLAAGPVRRKAIGAGVLAGLALKVLGERPWDGPVQQVPGWDIAIAPLAHADGAMAGVLCGLLAGAWQARNASPPV